MSWGIRTVWIIDPERRKGYVMSISDPAPVELATADYFTIGSELEPLFSLQELFEELDGLNR